MEKIKIRNSLYIREQEGEDVHYYTIDQYGKNEVCPTMLVEELVLTGGNLYTLKGLNMPEAWKVVQLYYKII